MDETRDPTRQELARLRAEGAGRIDPLAAPWLQAGAVRAGRSLVLSRLGADHVALLGWAPGSEPLDDDPRSSPSPLLSHTFAACLGSCWRYRDAHPWPGSFALETDVIAALAEARGEELSPTVLGKVRNAMVLLRASMWLDPTVRTVRLGPRVAAWSEEQVDVLREAFDRLPHLRGDSSEAE
jgi:hypothetical protein